jgi:hypothetical protein
MVMRVAGIFGALGEWGNAEMVGMVLRELASRLRVEKLKAVDCELLVIGGCVLVDL